MNTVNNPREARRKVPVSILSPALCRAADIIDSAAKGAVREMKPVKFNAVLAAARQRPPALTPRLVRRDDAKTYLAAPQLFVLIEEAGWITPVVNKHRMTLFDVRDIDSCIERLKEGEFPSDSPSLAA